MFGGAIDVEGKKVLGDMQRTIGGHVKCSVRSMFSCCFALAILSYVLEVLLVYPAKCLELLRRASVVFTCDRDLTGRLLLARALAQIWRHPCYSTDDMEVRSRRGDVGLDEQISSYMSLQVLENMSR
jgi:hypothetical protein